MGGFCTCFDEIVVFLFIIPLYWWFDVLHYYIVVRFYICFFGCVKIIFILIC